MVQPLVKTPVPPYRRWCSGWCRQPCRRIVFSGGQDKAGTKGVNSRTGKKATNWNKVQGKVFGSAAGTIAASWCLLYFSLYPSLSLISLYRKLSSYVIVADIQTSSKLGHRTQMIHGPGRMHTSAKRDCILQKGSRQLQVLCSQW